MSNEPPEHDAARHWETHAEAWIRWARAGQRRLLVLQRGLPDVRSCTRQVDVGGRVRRGSRLTGSHRPRTVGHGNGRPPRLLAAAEAAGSAHSYRLADAAGLPFEDDEFDRVVAYNG